MKLPESILAPAQGFLELGLLDDAWNELDNLEIVFRIQPEAMQLRLEILLAMKRWEDAVAMGTGCCQKWPRHDGFFFGTAKALIAVSDHGNALSLLKIAPVSLHKRAEVHFMMARCASRAGQIPEAILALQESFKRDSSYKQLSLDDPDFEAVWASFSS